MDLPAHNPLLALHEEAGAELQSYADTPIVATFGQPQAEYAAIRRGAAAMDQPQRGLLEFTGRDRLPFLNNLLTNQTWDKQSKRALPANAGVYAFFLNAKGRIFADVTVLELGERTLLEMDARLLEPALQAFEKYRFAEQVKMSSARGLLHELMVMGPGALAALNRVAESPLPELQPLASASARLAGHDAIVYRDDPAEVPGYTLILPVAAAEPVWSRLTANPPGEAADTDDLRFRGLARPVGWAAFNAARIEAARPIFGIDFDDSVLPAETGQLNRAVSFTKGCYLGQEIVARMHARGQLARQLVCIRMESDALPISGSKVYDDAGNEIGGITSSTLSPVLSNTAICLGYVKKPFINPGSRIQVPAEGAMHPATVVEGFGIGTAP